MSVEFEKGLVAVLSGVGVARPRLPQPPVFPSLKYQKIYVTRQNAVDGNATGAVETGIQIDCIAESHFGALALADSVRSALNRYIGTWGTLKCLFASLQTENDLSTQDGDNIKHRISQRYQVWTNDV